MVLVGRTDFVDLSVALEQGEVLADVLDDPDGLGVLARRRRRRLK